MGKMKLRLKCFIAILFLTHSMGKPYNQIDYDYLDGSSSTLMPSDSINFSLEAAFSENKFQYSDESSTSMPTDSINLNSQSAFTVNKFEYSDGSCSTLMPKGCYKGQDWIWETCRVESFMEVIVKSPSDVLGIIVDNTSINSLGERMAFAEYNQLRRLCLRFAKIDEIESYSLVGLERLVDLNLTHNEIFLIWHGAFDNLNSLKFLDLSHNKLLGVDNDTFNGLDGLVLLNLRNNKIIDLAAEAFSKLSALQTLDISENQIFLLTNDVININLNYNQANLDFSHNNLSKLYMNFENQPVVNTINFSYNTLDFIEAFTFSEIEVTYLDLSHNQLPTVDQYVFTASKIQYLNLSFNYFTYFNASIYKGITHVDLSNNRIATTNFNSNASLVVLDLSHNLITVLQVGPALDSLHAVNLGGNHIKTLTPDNSNVMQRNFFSSLQFTQPQKCRLIDNRIPCARLDEALILLECVLGSPENAMLKGVMRITCVDGNLTLYEQNLFLDSYSMFYLLVALSLLFIFVYYSALIAKVNVKISKR